jgi:hypothetical protein
MVTRLAGFILLDLHLVGQDAPRPCVKVEFAPFHSTHLLAAGHGQDTNLDTASSIAEIEAQCGHQRGALA